MSGLYGFNAPTADAQLTVIEELGYDDLDYYSTKKVGDESQPLSKSFSIELIGHPQNYTGNVYNYSVIKAGVKDDNYRWAYAYSPDFKLTGGLYGNINLIYSENNDNRSLDWFCDNADIIIGGDSKFIEDAYITGININGKTYYGNSYNSRVRFLLKDAADLSNANIRLFNGNVSEAGTMPTGMVGVLNDEFSICGGKLIIGDTDNPWINHTIKSISGIRWIELNGLVYREGEPLLVTKNVPYTDGIGNQAIVGIKGIRVNKLKLYKETDGGTFEEYTPPSGTIIPLIQIEGSDINGDGNYVTAQQGADPGPIWYGTTTAGEMSIRQNGPYPSFVYDGPGSAKYGVIPGSITYSGEYSATGYENNSADYVRFRFANGDAVAYSSDRKYMTLYSFNKAITSITIGGVKWNIDCPVIRTTDAGGDYSFAWIDLVSFRVNPSKYIFENGGDVSEYYSRDLYPDVQPGDTLTLFDGSGLTNVTRDNILLPSQYDYSNTTWTKSEDDSNNNTTTWNTRGLEYSVYSRGSSVYRYGEGITVSGKRDDTITSTVTDTSDGKQNWKVNYSAGEADISSIEARV